MNDNMIWDISDWSITKVYALILKKAEFKEICTEYNNKCLYFERIKDINELHSSFVNIRINNSIHSITYNYGKIIFEFGDNFIYDNNIKNKYGKYLEHITTHDIIKKRFRFIFTINNITKIKKYLMNINFYENIRDNGFLHLLIGIEYIVHNSNTLNINEISKWIKYYKIIEDHINNDINDNINGDNCEEVLNVLNMYNNNTSNESTKNLGINIISKSLNIHSEIFEYITIIINNIRLFKYHKLEPFKYKFHPGFSLFCILMKDKTFFDYIALNLEKTIFKNL